MGTDVPGVECYNHTRGPGPPCQCNRFYEATTCSPPSFFDFTSFPSQLPGEWEWLDDVDTLTTQKDTLDCVWLWEENNLPLLKTAISLFYEDNPGYSPGVDDFQFIRRIRVEIVTGLGPTVAYKQEQKFGLIAVPIPRNFTWGTIAGSWLHVEGNPSIPPPTGTQTYIPAVCNANWEP